MTNNSKKGSLIFVTGPEASGKSLLTQELGQKMHCPWVPEYAREYLEELGRPYQKEDILKIGQQQWQLQQNMQQLTMAPYLICDTGFLVLKIWMEFKYNIVDPWIEAQFLRAPVDLYLLCKPDIPWEPDPLREHPDQREELYRLYLEALEKYDKPYVLIEGDDLNQRLKVAQSAIEKL
jgi:nicotinamide riboside kinase